MLDGAFWLEFYFILSPIPWRKTNLRKFTIILSNYSGGWKDTPTIWTLDIRKFLSENY